MSDHSDGSDTSDTSDGSDTFSQQLTANSQQPIKVLAPR